MAEGIGHDSHVHLIPHLEGLDQRREIGRGSFGAVYEVKMNGLPCIAKGLHDILLGRGGNLPIREADKEAIRAKFGHECALLGNLKHPNIVQFLGVHRSKDNDEWLVMEYLHMDLAKCLEMYPDIPLPLKLSILQDVSYGLLHLHSQAPPIIHRDLTAPNILLTQGMLAKIADLGVSKIFDIRQAQRSAHTAAPGTWAYMPPEALSPDPKYDAKLDMFSYGVLTLYVANQEFPIVYEPPIPPLVTEKQEIQIYKRKHWVDKMGVAHPLHSVVMSCLMDRPDHRPTSKELNDIITKLCTQHVNSCTKAEELHLSKIKQQLEEELQTKDQQVKQYKKQVDSYKAELEKCQAALQQKTLQLDGCERELEGFRKSQNEYKKQVDYHKDELQKCQEELRRSQMDLKQLNEKWIREKLLEAKVSENERMVQPQATVLSSSSRPKTEYAHNMASAVMSHDGRTQGYQALTHTAHRSPMPPDQSVPPPTPSNQLVSSRTIQGAQPPPQAQYSNADRMQYESRDYPHKPHGDTFNDYGYNQGPQSLPTHSSTLPQQYGGGYIYDDQSSRRPYQRLPPQQSPHVQQSDIEAGYDADGRDYALNQPSLQLRQERPVGPYPPNNYYSKSEWIHPQPRDEDIRSQQLKQQQLYQGARFPHLSHQYPEGPPQGMLGHPIAASESAGVRQPRPPQSYEAGESSVGMPYDPNLTCTYCGERFRVGEIQNFRRHVTAHGGGRGRNE